LREFAARDVDLVINMSGLAGELAEAGYSSVEAWDVEDPYGREETTFQRILAEIQGRVRKLAQRLREKQSVTSQGKIKESECDQGKQAYRRRTT
jgi:hypothetical protein